MRAEAAGADLAGLHHPQGAATPLFALVAPLASDTGSKRRSFRGGSGSGGIQSGSLLVDCKVRGWPVTRSSTFLLNFTRSKWLDGNRLIVRLDSDASIASSTELQSKRFTSCTKSRQWIYHQGCNMSYTSASKLFGNAAVHITLLGSPTIARMQSGTAGGFHQAILIVRVSPSA